MILNPQHCSHTSSAGEERGMITNNNQNLDRSSRLQEPMFSTKKWGQGVIIILQNKIDRECPLYSRKQKKEKGGARHTVIPQHQLCRWQFNALKTRHVPPRETRKYYPGKVFQYPNTYRSTEHPCLPTKCVPCYKCAFQNSPCKELT